jgi:putative peptidoglycan lipid II flippase
VRVLNLKDPEIRKTLLIIGPIILGGLSGYINTVVDRTLASRMAEGSISALTYAVRIRGLVLGLSVMLLTTVLYPLLSEHAAEKDKEKLIALLNFGLKSIMLISLPAIAVLVVLNPSIVRLLYQRGSFTTLGTLMTSRALFFYSFSILGLGISDLLTKMFYSLKDTRTPMIISLFTVALNILLNLFFSQFMGYAGLALATSIAALSSALILFVYLNQKVLEGNIRIMAVSLKSLFSVVIMGLLMYFLAGKLNPDSGTTLSQIMKLTVVVIAGGVSYTALLYLLKVQELYSVINSIRSRFFR